MSSPKSPAAELRNFEAIEKYLQKSVGRDMALKAIVYPIRLATVHCDQKNKDLIALLQRLILNIIDARMLSNSWKGISAYLAGFRAMMSSEAIPLYQRVLVTLSFFCRAVEQFSGDVGYIQSHVMTHWSRARISWHYKFWKTMSLTCCAFLELIKIVNLQQKRRNLRRCVTQSPLTTYAAASKSFPTDPAVADKEEEDRAALTAMKWSALFLTRNICDCIVYYQWMESYRPNKTLEYLCGTFSGVVGVWLVWRDTKYPQLKSPSS